MWTATAARLNPPDPRRSFAGPPGAPRLPALRPAALGRGPGRRVRTAPDIPRHTVESVAVLSRFHCRAWSVAPVPLPAAAWTCPSHRSFHAGQRRCSAVAAADHVQAGPAARPGAARCRLTFWLRRGSDVAGSNAAVVPRRPGERGMRNGNVPRRSTHPLEVFPRVQ
jgi:hypothetical protein